MTENNTGASDSDDDDFPLFITKGSYTKVKKCELQQKSEEKCDMCDEDFCDMYSLLIHNTKHMIIPLLHISLPECFKCNQLYISPVALKHHTINKHLNITNRSNYTPDVLESFIKKVPYVVLSKLDLTFEDEKDITIEEETEEFLQHFIEKQAVTVLTKEPLLSPKPEVKENLLENFMKQESVVLEPLIITIDDDSMDGSTESSCLESSMQHKIRDRILFEDDSEDEEDIIKMPDGVMDDLTNSCNVKIELLKGNYNAAYDNDSNGISKKNLLILGQCPNDTKPQSIHYDDLIKPGVFRCKKCSMYFPNRYHLIIHEIEHIKFSRRPGYFCHLCDWYIGNDYWSLKRHWRSKHPGEVHYKPSNTFRKCDKCGLKYRHIKRHMANYHRSTNTCEGEECDKDIFTQKEYLGHENISKLTENGPTSKKLSTKIIKVCEVCSMFLKKTNINNYIYMGIVNKLGVRLQCELCEKFFFDLKLVKSVYKAVRRKSEKKPLTNTERLKNLRQRLKKLKSLNKF